MPVTTPKPKFVIKGSLRYTLRAFNTMANRLSALDQRRPDLNILNIEQKTQVANLVVAMTAKLNQKTP